MKDVPKGCDGSGVRLRGGRGGTVDGSAWAKLKDSDGGFGQDRGGSRREGGETERED